MVAGPGRGGAANGASFGSFAASSFPGSPAPGTPVFGSGNRDFESLTLMKMRQKAERARLIAEMDPPQGTSESRVTLVCNR